MTIGGCLPTIYGLLTSITTSMTQINMLTRNFPQGCKYFPGEINQSAIAREIFA
ncbi:hypothetical protein BJJLLNOG_00157 [Ostreid herpesvirus 1]|nr:hypothetical protein LKIMDMGE_00142 [Ostreid herpesvirus 1]UPX72322.1 hypothetical protein LKIMDMGE_00157 [Ostreid herpesvirus 1]UPX72466.1 hypothetical protein AADDAKMG_00140 [Ostreid herpesvirus 1]UPX72481.1 hypothetical protein AADDAKMG_00155 [Ostreid herpesvirus 1]UPX72626.1 hypothetical protein CEAEFCCE_00141 [Ostreid herpesvirus 1]